MSWIAMALGGICGSVLGGYALDGLPIDKIFLLFTTLPAIQLFSCGLVEETPIASKVQREDITSNGGSDSTVNGIAPQDKSSPEKSMKGALRQRRQQSAKLEYDVSEVNGSLGTKWYHSLKNATFTLFRAFRQPIILR